MASNVEDCAIEERVRNLKKAGFSGLIHYWKSANVKTGRRNLPQFDLGEEKKSTGDYPVIWILPDDAKRVQSSYTYKNGVLAFIPAPPTDEKDGTLTETRHTIGILPVILVVVVLVVVLVGFVCLKMKK